MYQAPAAELKRQELRLSPRSIWIRLLVACAVGLLAPPIAVLLAKQMVWNHNIWSLIAALGALPLGVWAFAARAHPRTTAKSFAILSGILAAVLVVAFIGLLVAFPIGMFYQPHGAVLPPHAGA